MASDNRIENDGDVPDSPKSTISFSATLLLRVGSCLYSFLPQLYMEIDKAIKESDDRRLKTKYNNAVYVIKRALALYSIEELALSFNGGKDSTVLLHLLRAGYFLHTEESPLPNGHLSSHKDACPIRVIYFESPSAFPEINSFTYETAKIYSLKMDITKLDFKYGLETLLKSMPIRAIFLGVRIGDPTAVGQEQFSPSSPGWPPFMRVNPILDWSYRDVWSFLLTCKVQYCTLYDQGYTSIGSIYDTVPNALLCIKNSFGSVERFRPAYLLSDGRSERAGRVRRHSTSVSQSLSALSNGWYTSDMIQKCTHICSVIAVGDEILSGTVEDQLGPSLCKKLRSAGWDVTHMAVVQNEIDSVAEEVEVQKSHNDMVFVYGGVGPLLSDVTMAGIAKAFGVRLAPDEEYEEYLRCLTSQHCTGDRNEMAQLPEGITELLHHEGLSVPLIKCRNVIVFTASSMAELETEWQCLEEIARSTNLVLLKDPFATKCFAAHVPDVESAQAIAEVTQNYPDIHVVCYRKSRSEPLIIRFEGKDKLRIKGAAGVLAEKFRSGALVEMD